MTPESRSSTDARSLSKAEAKALGDRAFALETAIKELLTQGRHVYWQVAERLYEFHEGGLWVALGYATLADFLAQPDLGMSRTTFFQMTRLWRDLVVVRQVPAETIGALEPTKVREVLPAIRRGDVGVDKALDDAASLGYLDLRATYGPGGSGPDAPLDAEAEPARVQCQECGSWRTPQELREWAEAQ